MDSQKQKTKQISLKKNMERIEIKHFDLEFERNIQTTESFVELHNTYLRYKAIYDSEIPEDREDLMRGWKSMFYDSVVKSTNY